ncbi:MAG TPA: selenide, water dikinase SelD [Bryobacteraceae bacterium]|nr:selenide, water dikinase SelD [Bryobacteraceae bacterium]
MSAHSTPKLTGQVKAGGCASKLSPKILDQVLPRIPRVADPNVMVGFDTADDAGVYRLRPDLAIVQTVDFFTPVVDDPYTFGAIAAANALSDVYAMGGRPLTALSILAWPGSGEHEVLEQILKGGAEKIHEAGCVILGGHSVNDPEIKFGYAITGTVHPDRVKTNTGARPGDVLVFTKKIGTGVISTALKRGIAKDEHVDGAIAQMLTLNRAAAEAIEHLNVHGLTDVTGFGLFGHAREMAIGSGVTLEIDSSLVRFLDGAIGYAEAGAFSGGLGNNREFVASCVEGSSRFDDLFYDPQTSGGLLIALPEKDASELERSFPAAYRIGRVLERQKKPLRIL